MTNPLDDLLALTRVPGVIVTELRAIAEAVSGLPAIEEHLARTASTLGHVARDVERLRDTVVPQQRQVANVERIMESLDTRMSVVERTIQQLESEVAGAVRLLPDPDDERGVLSKAKDALTGG